MVVSKEHKAYQNLLKKGKGSILKGIRRNMGGGKGLIVGGVILLIFGLLFFPVAILGIIMIVFGIRLKKKREAGWITYYQEQSGLSEQELLRLDQELANSFPRVVLCKHPTDTKENFVAGVFTETHMVLNYFNPIVKRLEDIIAVAFSDSEDIWCMVLISRRDEDVTVCGLVTSTDSKVTLYKELVQEMCRANPEIIVGQEIVCEGRNYILERDGAQLIRLYKQGCKLEAAN